jgi:phosphatidylinositol alpha-1,6-mannosyltransferase
VHLLVTNDFPPKVGGIQRYLYELWGRLDRSSFAVLASRSHPDAARHDARLADEGWRIERYPAGMLLPTPRLAAQVRAQAARLGAGLVVLDPMLPLGAIGPRLGLPYALVLHGAEVTVPARLPATSSLTRRVLAGARLALCAGTYPRAEATRLLGKRRGGRPGGPSFVEVPPPVDIRRFRPLRSAERQAARERFGIEPEARVVLSVSRLVPRKGIDTLVRAAHRMASLIEQLEVVVGGSGRDRSRLERLARRGPARVRFFGEVHEEDLPLLYGAADVFVMACRTRFAGLEAEGFGMVFLEAQACAVPAIAGPSGGAPEAVEDGATGYVLTDARDDAALARLLARLLFDEGLRRSMGEAARQRVERSFDAEVLARRLAQALATHGG